MRGIGSTVLVTLLLVSALGGCASVNREDVGMVAGGVAGGYALHAITGGNTLGTIGGAVGGAYLGREIAKQTY